MDIFLKDGLKYYYDCDEGSGTRFDSGSNGLDVPAIGSVNAQASGALNNAVDTTGNLVNYLSAVHDDLFRVGDNPFTLTFWSKIQTGQEFALSPAVAHYDSDGVSQAGYQARYRGGTKRYEWICSADGSAVTILAFGTELTKDVWNFVVCTHDPDLNVITLEINRTGLVSTAHSGGIFNNTAPFTIGAAFGSGGLVVAIADVDEIGAWDRLLNSDELDTLYGSGTPPSFTTFTSSILDITIDPVQFRNLLPNSTSVAMIPKGASGGVLHNSHMQHYDTGLEIQVSSPCVCTVLSRLIKESDDR